jgi:hypothetical protein
MTEATEVTDSQDIRWWRWHLGDRMARHQHPHEDLTNCSWPECAWHGVRPGEDTLIDSLPEAAPRSVALSHLDGIGIAGGSGGFVYERDVIVEDDEDDEDLEFDA